MGSDFEQRESGADDAPAVASTATRPHVVPSSGPRTQRRTSPSPDALSTADRYATADWADPLDFAERRAFEPGDLWLGRCTVDDAPLGFRDERHAMILGSTRGYKGTTCVVPAHLTWLGSLFSLDPKGENATISAARRGDGNQHCVGMGQAVNVIDPFGESHVEDKYRKRFNPLDALDPDDDEFLEKAAAIADAIVVRPNDEKEPFWSNKARTLIKGLILHIKTSASFEPERKNLVTLRELALVGDMVTYQRLKDAGDDPSDPFKLLFRGMQVNHSCGHVIAGIGTEFLNLLLKNVDRQWSGFHSSLTDQTEFLDSPKLQASIKVSDFDLSDIKDHPRGMSLYLCLPTKHMATFHRWLRVMTNLVIYECRKSLGMGANGHRVLMCMDEFRTLEHMPEIERDISNLAGYGVKLMLVLQDLGQLKKVYGDSWESIWGSCGLIHAFAINDDFTLQQLSKHIGETDLTLTTNSESQGNSRQRNQSTSRTKSRTQGKSESHSKNQSHTENEAFGTSTSDAVGSSTSEAFGRSASVALGESNSTASGWSDSDTQGGNRTYGSSKNTSRNQGWQPPRLLGRNLNRFLPFLREGETEGMSDGESTNQGGGENWGHTSGRSGTDTQGNSRTNTEGTSNTKTTGTSNTHTEGSSYTKSRGKTAGTSDTQGRSVSDTEAFGDVTGSSEGVTYNQSRGQSHHKRPLVYPHDIKYYFASLETDEPFYPGLGLVLIPSERPMIVQRVNYYEDDEFDGMWDFNPAYPQTVPKPLVRSWLIGFEVEPDGHLWTDGTPKIGLWHKDIDEPIGRDEPILDVLPGPTTSKKTKTRLTVYAPTNGHLERIEARSGSWFDAGLVLGAVRYHMADYLRDRGYPVRDEVGLYNRGEHPDFIDYRRRVEDEEAERQRLAEEAEAARLAREEAERQEDARRREQAEEDRRAEREREDREAEAARLALIREEKTFKQQYLMEVLGPTLIGGLLVCVAGTVAAWALTISWPAVVGLGLLFAGLITAWPLEVMREKYLNAAWENKLKAEDQAYRYAKKQRRIKFFSTENRPIISCVAMLPVLFAGYGAISEAWAVADRAWYAKLGTTAGLVAASLFGMLVVGLLVACFITAIMCLIWLVKEGELVGPEGNLIHPGY